MKFGSWKIAEPWTPAGIARMVLFILEKPAHARIPQRMILPKERPAAMGKIKV